MTTACKEFADRIVDYVDGELPPAEAGAVARHLAQCESCRRTAAALQRSLGLARLLWEDNLTETAAIGGDAHAGVCTYGHAANRSRRRSFYAVAAGILLAAGILVTPVFHPAPKEPALTAEQVEREVARAGRAAELLAATRLVAQCEGTESIVQQQYRYILHEYADTPAAESLNASLNLKLRGTQHD
jgi:anti-sigma factor RsiW